MKKTLTIFILFITFSTFANIKTTVADGDWFDANNWSPVGVPLNEDTLVINHIITANDEVGFSANWMIIENNAEIISDTTFTLNGNYKGYGDITAQLFGAGGDTLLAYGSINGDHFVAGSSFTKNYGNILSDTISINGDFENIGLIDVNIFNTGATNFTNLSNAAINVASLATFAATNSVNESNATVVTSEFVTSGNFENNGDVSCTSWTHGSGTVSGSNGRFCISMCFINNSTINGTVDICDATPGNICDVDMGSIAGTVTNCANGACGNNVSVEEQEKVVISIYPNPAKNIITIDGAAKGSQLSIYSITGQVVKVGSIMNTNQSVDVSSLNEGIYIVKLSTGIKTEMRRLVIH